MACWAYSSVISVSQPALYTGAPTGTKVPNCGYYDTCSDTDTKWRNVNVF